MNRRQFINRTFAWTGLLFVPKLIRASNDLSDPQFVARLGASTEDSEVTDWVGRVVANGGSVSSSTRSAANTLMLAIKAAGLRSKISRMNLYAGTGLDACRTPFIKDLGGSVDVLNNFVSGDYSESTGLTGNASNKYNNTTVQWPDLFALDGTNHSISFGLYVRTNSDANHSMGAHDGTHYAYLSPGCDSGNSLFSLSLNGGNQCSASDAGGIGFYLGSHNTTTDRRLYKNGSQTAIQTSSDSGDMTGGGTPSSNRLIYVHGFANWNNNPATISIPTNKTFAGYLIGTGFSSSECAALYTPIQAFQTTLSRNV